MPEHEQEDAFGFRSVKDSARERVRNIRPSQPPAPPEDLSVVDEIAGNAGFVSREAALPLESAFRRGRPRASEPSEALNMRVPSSVANAFRRWCEENRYSYPAALTEIMRRAGIPTR